jgi:hypothetical protein
VIYLINKTNGYRCVLIISFFPNNQKQPNKSMSTTEHKKAIEKLIRFCDALKESLEKQLAAPPPPPKPTFVSRDTWEQMAYDVMDKATKSEVNGYRQIKLETAAKNMKQWKKAVVSCEGADVDSLWAHLLAYFKDNWTYKNSTRMTAMGAIKAITGRLGIPENGEYEDYYEEMQAQQKKDEDYKEVPLEESIAKFKCKDGKVLTTKKLRTMVDEMKTKPYERMLLSFFAYHGNRPQDWNVGYGKENKNERGYYDHETQTMHLFDGKTQKEGTERTFKVHDKVAECIAEASLFNTTRYLAPNSKGECDRKAIYRKLRDFQSRNNFPKGITPNDLRHLYETHIRYVEKLPRNERLKLMGGIAHSDGTSLKKYAKLYRPMVEWAEANEQ